MFSLPVKAGRPDVIVLPAWIARQVRRAAGHAEDILKGRDWVALAYVVVAVCAIKRTDAMPSQRQEGLTSD